MTATALMHWFLVFSVYAGNGYVGDTMGMAMPGQSTQVELAMPSQQECEAIRDANKFRQTECWAKPDAK